MHWMNVCARSIASGWEDIMSRGTALSADPALRLDDPGPGNFNVNLLPSWRSQYIQHQTLPCVLAPSNLQLNFSYIHGAQQIAWWSENPCVPPPPHQPADQMGTSKTETLFLWFVAVVTSIILLFQFCLHSKARSVPSFVWSWHDPTWQTIVSSCLIYCRTAICIRCTILKVANRLFLAFRIGRSEGCSVPTLPCDHSSLREKNGSTRSLSAKSLWWTAVWRSWKLGLDPHIVVSPSEYLNTHAPHFRDRNDIQAWIPTLRLRGFKLWLCLSILIEAAPKCWSHSKSVWTSFCSRIGVASFEVAVRREKWKQRKIVYLSTSF